VAGEAGAQRRAPRITPLLILVFEGNPLSFSMEHLSWCGATEKTLGNFKESVTAEAAMQGSGQLDELDCALVNALQTPPRALGKIIGGNWIGFFPSL
jgi:hypothetical protein